MAKSKSKSKSRTKSKSKSKSAAATASPGVYKVIEIVGTSTKSWADAGRNGVEAAARTIRDLRVAEVEQLDLKVEGGKLLYRAKLKVSFKYHS